MNNPREARSRRWRSRAIVATAVTLGISWLIAMAIPRHRLTVTIANDGPAPLREVVVHVTGRSYPLGGLEAGGETAVDVAPTSESHVEVEFVDSAGNKKRLDAGGYFEPGYRGTMTIHVASEELQHVEIDTSFY